MSAHMPWAAVQRSFFLENKAYPHKKKSRPEYVQRYPIIYLVMYYLLDVLCVTFYY